MSVEEATAHAAQAMREAVRVHKRSERAHRRSARDLMQKLAALEEECDRLGIELKIEAQTLGGHSYGGPNP